MDMDEADHPANPLAARMFFVSLGTLASRAEAASMDEIDSTRGCCNYLNVQVTIIELTNKYFVENRDEIFVYKLSSSTYI
ncbi:hypothetical protein WMW72_18895 [Paenibacillus filicis]|uniref:Uncharacterized protein n=1 Tax=Paenibacillus filicis TaxID=669464 RepID=A0ABU9DPJ4_9BACL